MRILILIIISVFLFSCQEQKEEYMYTFEDYMEYKKSLEYKPTYTYIEEEKKCTGECQKPGFSRKGIFATELDLCCCPVTSLLQDEVNSGLGNPIVNMTPEEYVKNGYKE